MVYIFLIPCLSEHLFFDGIVIETNKQTKLLKDLDNFFHFS